MSDEARNSRPPPLASSSSWQVIYSCQVKGKWITSKRKALLCVSRDSAFLTVVLPSDATCKTTKLLESVALSSPSGATGRAASMKVAKMSMRFKIGGTREFLARFSCKADVEACQNRLKGLVNHAPGADEANQWSLPQGCESASQGETQLEDSQTMDLEDMTQCSQESQLSELENAHTANTPRVETPSFAPPRPSSTSSPFQPAHAAPPDHRQQTFQSSDQPAHAAPAPPRQQTFQRSDQPAHAPPPLPSHQQTFQRSHQPACAAPPPQQTFQRSETAPPQQTFQRSDQPACAAPPPQQTFQRSDQPACAAPPPEQSYQRSETTETGNRFSHTWPRNDGLEESIEINEDNFEYYLNLCLSDPRFPCLVEKVERLWLKHLGLGSNSKEVLRTLLGP